MSQIAREIAARALQPPEEDRLALASELIDSVEDPVDPEWERAWADDLSRRRAHGTDDARPWDEIRAQLLQKLNKG